jgi:hypothetical protein
MIEWNQEVMKDANWRDHEAFNRACDAALADLRLVTPHRPFTQNAPTVVTVVRNEQLRLPDFIRHYKQMGIKCLHIIDNGSTDDTPKICAADSSITLWHTAASYAAAAYGQLWVGAIARQYGLGKWVLNVDGDEFFVYPDMDRYDVGDLQNWLANRGYRRVFAPLIDMYGARLYGAGGERDHRPLLLQNPFFDGGADQGQHSYMFEETPYGPLLAGGPRNRVMSAGNPKKFYLSKFPLSLWAADTAYASPHFPYPFSDNPITAHGALLHFKFLADFHNRVAIAIAEGEHWGNAAEYREYHSWIAGGGGRATLFSTQYSRIYRGPGSLIAAGLLQAIPWQVSGQTGPHAAPSEASIECGRAALLASEEETNQLGAHPAVPPAAENGIEQRWSSDASLKAVETQWDHRVEERRTILRFIAPGTVGAEIGVFTGLFSEFILQNASPRMLHLVDPWWNAWGDFFPDSDNYTDHGRLSTRIAQEAALARAQRASRTCVVQCDVAFSVDWLAQQEDGSLDWVYLDSSHTYEDTIEELELLRRKVRPGGYILGDDFYPDPSDPEFGVFRAVHEAIRRHPELELVYAGTDYQFALRIHHDPKP